MKLTWILGAVALLSLVAGLWIVTAGQTRKETLARQRAQAQQNVEKVIAQLSLPESTIRTDFNASSKIIELRRWSYELHGTTIPTYPQIGGGPDYGNRFADEQRSIEYKGLNDAHCGCETVWGWFYRPVKSNTTADYMHNPEAAYLKEHPEIYADQIRPRLLALSQSYSGGLAVAAIKALWAAGESHVAGIQRLEEIIADENLLGVSEATGLLTQFKHPLPVWPTDPAVLGACADPARTDANGNLPPGAAFRMDDPRLRCGDPVTAVSLSADGKTLVSGTGNGEIRVWDLPSGQFTAARVPPSQPNGGRQINQVLLLPDGTVAALANNMLYLWPGGQGEAPALISPVHPQPRGYTTFPQSYVHVAVSPDGKTLGALYRKWMPRSPDEPHTIVPTAICDLFPLPSCRPQKEEQLVPDWLDDHLVDLRKSPVAQLSPVKKVLGRGYGPWSKSQEGQTLVIAQGNRIRLFDLRGSAELYPPTFFCRPPMVLGRVDNRLFIFADERIRLYELPSHGDGSSPKEIDSVVPDDVIVSNAALAPGTRKLAFWGSKILPPTATRPSRQGQPSLAVLDLQGGQRLEIAPATSGATLAMDPFPGRYHLAVSGAEMISIYDTRSGKVESCFGCYSWILMFLGGPPNGCTNLLTLWSAPDGLTLYLGYRGMSPFQINGLLNSGVMAVSPGQSYLAVASDHSLYVWNIQKLQDSGPSHIGPVKRILAPGKRISALAWLDVAGGVSRFLVTAQSGRNDLVIWDVESGKPLVRLVGHDAQVVSMHCDGQGLLYTVGLDTTLIAWDVKELLKWCSGKVK